MGDIRQVGDICQMGDIQQMDDIRQMGDFQMSDIQLGDICHMMIFTI